MNTFTHEWAERGENLPGITTAIFESPEAWQRGEVVYVDTCWQEDGYCTQCPRGFETAVIDTMKVRNEHMNRTLDVARRYHQRKVRRELARMEAQLVPLEERTIRQVLKAKYAKGKK
jgi:uncharacterized protein (DUF2461 family)